jgi:hypothetical protein
LLLLGDALKQLLVEILRYFWRAPCVQRGPDGLLPDKQFAAAFTGFEMLLELRFSLRVQCPRGVSDHQLGGLTIL